jgi:hypothetical protein
MEQPGAVAHGGFARPDQIEAAVRLHRLLDRPHQIALGDEVLGQPPAAQRDALAAERRLDQHHVIIKYLAALRRLIAHAEGAEEIVPGHPVSVELAQMQQRLRQESGDAADRAAAFEVMRRAHRPDLVVEQAHRLDRGPFAAAIAHGEIDPGRRQIIDRRGGDEPELDVGMGGAELRHARHQPIGCEGDACRHRQLGRAAMAADVGRDIGDVLEPHRHGAMQPFAFPRQMQPAGMALEQGRAEKILEQLDLPADRRLGDRQFLRRPGEVHVPRSRLEHDETVGRRQGTAKSDGHLMQSEKQRWRYTPPPTWGGVGGGGMR